MIVPTDQRHRLSNETDLQKLWRKCKNVINLTIIKRELKTLPTTALISCPFPPSGVGKGRSSTIEVTEEKEKEVMTLDDDEIFGRFYKPVSPGALGSTGAMDTEQDFNIINTDTPK